jgi:uncharacterized protein YjiS (DUF1127 family)
MGVIGNRRLIVCWLSRRRKHRIWRLNMALLLTGERPATAAVTLNPFRLVAAWYGKARAARTQRLALHNRLSLDAHRLDDLGINRGDLFAAMHAEPRRGARLLNEARSRRSSDWLNP